MERGPMALFGAIVAVGLGPAMWLGAQFGGAIDLPDSPPAVTSERGPQTTQDKGGEAGSAPDNSVIVETTPRSEIQPLPNSPKRPKPHKTTKPAGGASPSPSSSSPAPGDGNGGGQSTPPSDGDQSTPPGGTGQGDGLPPSPPAGQTGGGTGSGGTGSGGTGSGGSGAAGGSGGGGSGGTSDGQPITG
jgi:hypothetical protein